MIIKILYMNNNLKRVFVGFVAMAFPAVIFAAGLDGLFSTLGNLIGKAQLLIVGLVSLAFFYGVFNFVLGANDKEKRESGKQFMIWSVVALFLMASIWGIVNILQETVGIDQAQQPEVPVWEYNE